MRRWGRLAAAALGVLALIASFAAWNLALRTPATHRLPLPPALIALESSAGRQLLAQSRFAADHDALMRNFEPQARPAYCGVASAAIVLNALAKTRPPLAQDSFFSPAARRVRSSWQVTFGGMTLAELGALLRAHGADAAAVYASDADVKTFRSVLEKNLLAPDDFVLVNYERAVLGQAASGHISPLAAYEASTDRVLVLDVAAYKYPPTWVSVEALWKAMNTQDPTSGRTRGFVVVR